ncbi:MAG TPA: hypothetical protein VK431_02535 [Nitrosopumilaceae archaeon]|nr:hypothetical protein [Nitrosopumilaceae archaeon]
MTVQPEIKQIIENQMELMIKQAKAYLPFIKLAFPGVTDLPEMCFNLIVGNVLTTFVTQYAMRMQYPNEQDFVEFGTITQKYKEKIKEMF